MSGIYSGSGSNIPPPQIIEDLGAWQRWDIDFTTDSRILMKKPGPIHQAEIQMVPRPFVQIVVRVIEC
jgi:hypothetical protein